jgi:hypothetical protein
MQAHASWKLYMGSEHVRYDHNRSLETYDTREFTADPSRVLSVLSVRDGIS